MLNAHRYPDQHTPDGRALPLSGIGNHLFDAAFTFYASDPDSRLAVTVRQMLDLWYGLELLLDPRSHADGAA